MFRSVLVANRGEIALRILRACQEMGIHTVAIHSVADEGAMHVRLADESVCIGRGPSRESYLNMQAILAAAEITGAEAIHPGIGFLSENAEFATMVREHGFAFIGPRSEHIKMMGDKLEAKAKAQAIGLPIVPGSPGGITDFKAAEESAETIGYPLLFKAAAGGGGKGMRVVTEKAQLKEAFELTRAEALRAFCSESVYMEKYLPDPRHIEVQIIGDQQGNVVHLYERECSIQRQHQKVWEEAPCAFLSQEARENLGTLAVQAMKKLGYENAGTLEFLYLNDAFYFIEMNTRLQVEHSVTEEVTGVDLVREQIQVAAGYPLSFSQKEIQLSGHAIECRINAEDPETFLPMPGLIEAYLPPGGPGIRVDSALYAGCRVPPFYDSLISKLIAHDQTRERCLARLKRALNEYVITGISTLLPLHQRIAHAPEVQKNEISTHWLERFLSEQS